MNPLPGKTTWCAGRFLLWFATLFLLTGLTGTTRAQIRVADCKVGSRAAATGFWTWQPDTRVYVYVLQNAFSKEEISSLITPIQLWDAVSEVAESKVRLTYAGTTPVPLECENCLTILRGNVHKDKARHGGEIRAFGINGTRIIHHASIVIDPRMNTSESLKSAVAHELGHSFGLQDCYDCKDRSTVMIKFGGFNLSNRLEGPTGCDVTQVRKAYIELKKRYRPVVVQEDEGEEGVPDDTPLVIPEPGGLDLLLKLRR
ncbi:MAG TPA: hypothetical protein VJU84_06300 [Pyrinomonadaceae bacterium]|nr:hypothetical protein [Pyrinomonadaceae bacterium]